MLDSYCVKNLSVVNRIGGKQTHKIHKENLEISNLFSFCFSLEITTHSNPTLGLEPNYTTRTVSCCSSAFPPTRAEKHLDSEYTALWFGITLVLVGQWDTPDTHIWGDVWGRWPSLPWTAL